MSRKPMFSANTQIEIYWDPRPAAEVAKSYGVSIPLVYKIKAGNITAQNPGSKEEQDALTAFVKRLADRAEEDLKAKLAVAKQAVKRYEAELEELRSK